MRYTLDITETLEPSLEQAIALLAPLPPKPNFKTRIIFIKKNYYYFLNA